MTRLQRQCLVTPPLTPQCLRFHPYYLNPFRTTTSSRVSHTRPFRQSTFILALASRDSGTSAHITVYFRRPGRATTARYGCICAPILQRCTHTSYNSVHPQNGCARSCNMDVDVHFRYRSVNIISSVTYNVLVSDNIRCRVSCVWRHVQVEQLLWV